MQSITATLNVCELLSGTFPCGCMCAVCVRVCMWAWRVGPDWKCDLILINDNHMEHDCMIYHPMQKTAEGCRLQEDESSFTNNVARVYWWGDTHERIDSFWKRCEEMRTIYIRMAFFWVKIIHEKRLLYKCWLVNIKANKKREILKEKKITNNPTVSWVILHFPEGFCVQSETKLYRENKIYRHMVSLSHICLQCAINNYFIMIRQAKNFSTLSPVSKGKNYEKTNVRKQPCQKKFKCEKRKKYIRK